MQSKAQTIEQYLDELPEERKQPIVQVRDIILQNLPEGIEEVMNWGMISYEVPFNIYPDTYNKKPLLYAALASQKNHMALYLSGIYTNESLKNKFLSDYQETGKKLDMGKSCVRFKKIEDLPLDVIGKAIGAISTQDFVEFTKSCRRK